MWPERLSIFLIAAAILAGSWLVWQSLTLAEPAPAIAPPPISTRSFVQPVTRLPIPESPPFVSIGTPEQVFVNDPCVSWREPVPGVFRHPRCRVMPTPGPGDHYGMGSIGSANS